MSLNYQNRSPDFHNLDKKYRLDSTTSKQSNNSTAFSNNSFIASGKQNSTTIDSPLFFGNMSTFSLIIIVGKQNQRTPMKSSGEFQLNQQQTATKNDFEITPQNNYKEIIKNLKNQLMEKQENEQRQKLQLQRFEKENIKLKLQIDRTEQETEQKLSKLKADNNQLLKTIGSLLQKQQKEQTINTDSTTPTYTNNCPEEDQKLEQAFSLIEMLSEKIRSIEQNAVYLMEKPGQIPSQSVQGGELQEKLETLEAFNRDLLKEKDFLQTKINNMCKSKEINPKNVNYIKESTEILEPLPSSLRLLNIQKGIQNF